MDDILDIYEPIYETTNYIPIITLIIAVIILLLIGLFLYRKHKKDKEVTLESTYKKSLDDILFLKGEAGKIGHRVFVKRANTILFEYLSFHFSEDYIHLTSKEIIETFKAKTIISDYILNFFSTRNDLILFGKDEIINEDRIELLKEYGELLTSLYRSTLND